MSGIARPTTPAETGAQHPQPQAKPQTQDPKIHPSREQLERFLRGELYDELGGAIARHLLARCPQCLQVTRRLWAGESAKVPKPNKPARDAQPRKCPPRASGGPRKSAAARAALESAARERLLELVDVLEAVGRALKSIAAALPPPPDSPSGEDSVPVELRALIDCVLVDSLGPAIENLRAAREGRGDVRHSPAPHTGHVGARIEARILPG